VTEAAPEIGDEQLAAAVRDISISPGHAVLSGFRQPVVAVLLLIALCTAISGKPLDGVLMVTVAALLVFDAARTRMRGDAATTGAATTGAAGSRVAWRRRIWAGLAAVAAGGLYAGFVGSFSRYSWPATVAVMAVGCLVVAIGWQGPLRHRPGLTGTAQRRSWLWAVIVVVGGSWELSSLLQQPHLTTDSYAHPTISALTDPLLNGHPGRSLVLAGWLLIGWLLAGR
jgi:hypothetical protein